MPCGALLLVLSQALSPPCQALSPQGRLQGGDE